MTVGEFRTLSLEMQCTVVKCVGVFLLERRGVGVTAKLYQVNSFYVEAFLDEKKQGITRMVAFDDTHKLEPYLHLVSFAELHPLL